MESALFIHNKFGILWDEKIYKRELIRRCREAGFEKVITEVPIVVSYNGFQTHFYVDIFFDAAASKTCFKM